MKIDKIIYQNRRDFKAVYKCQFCGSKVKGGGYDDRNFHDNVIPNLECESCNKSVVKNSDEMNEEYRALQTKYPEEMQI